MFSYKTGLSSERSRDRRESSSYFSYDNYTSLLDEFTVSFPSLRDGSIPSVPASFFYGITLHSSFQYRWLRRSSFFVLGHCESRFFIWFLRNEKEKKKRTRSMNEEREKCEDRVSRTPNLLIWNQTRYHCAMPSLFCEFHSPISVIGVSVGFGHIDWGIVNS